MYKFAQILQSGHLTNKIRVFKEMNTWTHRHTWLFNLQTADPLLPLSSFFLIPAKETACNYPIMHN